MESFTLELERILTDEKDIASRRDDVIKRLVDELRVQISNVKALELELEQSRCLNTKYAADHEELMASKASLEKKMSSSPFVLVLIDGDDTLFLDHFVSLGAAGGEAAAKCLHNGIRDYLESLNLFESHWVIVVRIFAKLGGLAQTYFNAGVIRDGLVFRKFVQGFNSTHSMCDYIDAGPDKEGADSIIKSNLDLFYDNTHCKHIMIAGSGDSGYTGPLRRFAPSEGVCERITLIEASPFAYQLKPMASKFRTTTLPDVFRTSKLLSNPSAALLETPSAFNPSAAVARRTSLSRDESLTTAYSDIVQRPATVTTIATPPPSPARSNNLRTIKISYNKAGERMDSPLSPYNKTGFDELKKQKLCNRFYLTRCNYDDCTHSHKAIPSTVDTKLLRAIARMSVCYDPKCSNPTCVMAHICPYQNSCTFGKNCKFPKHRHAVDTKIATTQEYQV